MNVHLSVVMEINNRVLHGAISRKMAIVER